MTTRYDYALLEFAANLAEAEASYGVKLQTIIDTFSQSRLDLPLKRLSEIAKVHGRAAQNLKKFMDPKKNEHLNLWKMCNVYSCIAVDLDKAMRETRSTLKTKMTADGSLVDKPKKRNIFNSILTNSTRNVDITSEKTEKEKSWFSKLSGNDRKAEFRTSRKATLSQEVDKEEHTTTAVTPIVTPRIIRVAGQPDQNETTVIETVYKPPRPPRPEIPNFQTETNSPPVQSPQPSIISYPSPHVYATPIYGDLQKTVNGLNNNNRMILVEEHSLRHTDDSTKRELTRTSINGCSTINDVRGYDNSTVTDSGYVNIRPQIAQKPRILTTERSLLPNSRKEMVPTLISVDECYHATPIPSPRKINTLSEPPIPQRSSSSTYSSNYQSPSNVTSFVIDDNNSSRIGK